MRGQSTSSVRLEQLKTSVSFEKRLILNLDMFYYVIIVYCLVCFLSTFFFFNFHRSTFYFLPFFLIQVTHTQLNSNWQIQITKYSNFLISYFFFPSTKENFTIRAKFTLCYYITTNLGIEGGSLPTHALKSKELRVPP